MTDVYENFIDLFGLDPTYYVSAWHYFNDAMLKGREAQLPLLTDPNMHLLFEDGKRERCIFGYEKICNGK